MRIFYFGYAGKMGGANTELWHTVKLWRKMGIDVTLVPTWSGSPPPQHDEQEEKFDLLGCRTVHTSADQVEQIEGLPGSITVGFCNTHYLTIYPILKKMGCKTVWVNCMTFLFPNESIAFKQFGAADAYMFQSAFQQQELDRDLGRLQCGYTPDRGFLIRGALSLDEFLFSPRPHAAGEEFVIGRLSRPDLDKWSSNHFPILTAVPYSGRRSLNMGWNAELAKKLGAPPAWAECLAPQQIPVAEFLGRCHAMIGLNGGARENWPRVGLEAMAAGVPLVCQKKWGWTEMVEHGKTGFLFGPDQEAEYYLARLAYDEDLRMEIVHNARLHVERLTDADVLGRQWQALFDSVSQEKSTQQAAA